MDIVIKLIETLIVFGLVYFFILVITSLFVKNSTVCDKCQFKEDCELKDYAKCDLPYDSTINKEI